MTPHCVHYLNILSTMMASDGVEIFCETYGAVQNSFSRKF